jgi:hypothetical protein
MTLGANVKLFIGIGYCKRFVLRDNEHICWRCTTKGIKFGIIGMFI